MSFSDHLAQLLARDARYALAAYAFVFEAIEHTKGRMRERGPVGQGPRTRRARPAPRGRVKHVTGQDLCSGAAELARLQYGGLAWTVLSGWGLRTTSDIGETVYNLIAVGDLEKTPEDSRSDFEDVFDLEAVLRAPFPLEDEAKPTRRRRKAT
jgi:uncharacterized repeat protein (TIGR04138 family)